LLARLALVQQTKGQHILPSHATSLRTLQQVGGFSRARRHGRKGKANAHLRTCTTPLHVAWPKRTYNSLAQDCTSSGRSKVRRSGNVTGRHTLASKGAQKKGCARLLMLRMLLAQGSAGGRAKWHNAPNCTQVAQNESTAAPTESNAPMVD